MYRFTYNENHFPVAVELPGERRVTLEYDTLSRVVKETDAAGRMTQTRNGSFAEITRRALDDDHVWKAGYNEHGQVIQETDPEGRVTRYGYDEQGLAGQPHGCAGRRGCAGARCARGQLTRYTDCSGRTTDYEYDEDGNLTAVTDAEEKTVRISYNRLRGCRRRSATPVNSRTVTRGMRWHY